MTQRTRGHIGPTLGAVYDRHSYDAEKRHALDLWGSYVERVAAGEHAPSNVVELARAGRCPLCVILF